MFHHHCSGGVEEEMRTTKFKLAIAIFGMILTTQTAWAGRNLTFVAWTDTHYGAYDYSDTTRLQTIGDINNLVNTSYPTSLNLGKVGQTLVPDAPRRCHRTWLRQ